MADALASGASSRKGVRVQVPPRPPKILLSASRQAYGQLNPTNFLGRSDSLNTSVRSVGHRGPVLLRFRCESPQFNKLQTNLEEQVFL